MAGVSGMAASPRNGWVCQEWLGVPGMAGSPRNGWESQEWLGVPGMAGNTRNGRNDYCLHPAPLCALFTFPVSHWVLFFFRTFTFVSPLLYTSLFLPHFSITSCPTTLFSCHFCFVISSFNPFTPIFLLPLYSWPPSTSPRSSPPPAPPATASSH